jgi:hypothetical protein
MEVLLGSIVDYWDTFSKKQKGEGRLEQLDVSIDIEETNIVVIVDKGAKDSVIFEGSHFLVPDGPKIVHTLHVVEDRLDVEVHWVVQGSSQRSLIGCYVVDISVEDLTNLIHAGSLTVLGPELALYLWDGVHSDSLETELLHGSMDPVLEGLPYKGMILIQIRKVSKSAIFNFVGVVPVVDLALGMVVLVFVEWNHTREIQVDVSHVVSNNIEHNPDVLLFSFSHKFLQVLFSSKMGVHGVPVESAVSVVVFSVVNWDGRDPDCVKSHARDVVKFGLNALEGSTAVSVKITWGTRVIFVSGEPVGDNLINCSLLPFFGRGGESGMAKET